MGSFSPPTVLRKKPKKSIFAPIMVGLLSLANNLPSDKNLMFIRARAESSPRGAQNQLKDHSPTTMGSIYKTFTMII